MTRDAGFSGLDSAVKMLDGIDRRMTRERQDLMVASAKTTLVPAIAAEASKIPGRPGQIIAKAVRARKGKQGAVLVGPDRKKAVAKKLGKTTWNWMPIAHFFIAGSKPHEIGGAKSRSNDYYSAKREARESKWNRTRGGWARRYQQERKRVMLSGQSGSTTIGHPFLGPVTHPGIPEHDVVVRGADQSSAAFCEALAEQILGSKESA